jgi:putative methionine-R-sulfoxide reductase with GAF domain
MTKQIEFILKKLIWSFFIKKEKKGKQIGFIFGVFRCGIMNILNIKKCSCLLRKLKKNINSNLHKFIRILYIKKINKKINMFLGVYMHEHFDLIINPFK